MNYATPLIVPIDVAALCVGRPDADAGAAALAPTADFSVLPYTAGGHARNAGAYTSAQALSGGGPFSGTVPLARGIHLHFALPDGLTHGLSDGKAPLTFPAVPNRWLVSRIVATGASVSSVTSWVVESDRLNTRAVVPPGFQQPTVPMAPSPGQNFRFAGQVFPLEGWSEKTSGVERIMPLTAPGYGEPTFAALYPNSSTVFGFHDDLSDLEDYDPAQASVSYHVAGWYGGGTADPLADGKFDPSDNAFGWTCTDGPVPTSTVCTGAVARIAWDPKTRYLGQPPQPLTTAIGGSLAEALSALMASVIKEDGAEQVLNALQFGLLTREGAIDSIEAFEEAVHAAGFGSVSGGPMWAVVKDPAGPQPETGEEVTLPDPLAAELNKLNDTQLRRTALDQELKARRWQLFVDWHKYLLVVHERDSVPAALRDQADAVRGHLRAEVRAITGLVGRAAAADAEIAAQRAVLEPQLPKGTGLSDDVVAPRYYHPADPVLLLQGADVQPAQRYGGDGRLPCQRAGELVRPAGMGHAPQVGLGAVPQDAPGDLLQALLHQAILVGLGPGPGQSAEGSPPHDPYLTEWAGTPWLPFLLQYEVELQPLHFIDPESDDAPYPPGLVNDRFKLTPDGIDLDYTGAKVQGDVQLYSGTVVLTPGATVDLAAEVEQFAKAGGAEPAALLDAVVRVRQLPLLAQGLGGLGEAMLMRELTLQMPVADPLAPLPDAAFAREVAAAVDDQNLVSPMPEESFNPLRAGLLRVMRLRLVDTFGRFRDYDDASMVVAKGLAAPPALADGRAFLPPRITQPARLMFRWRSASDDAVETNSHPATSPVVGWVVPNHVDRSLLLYEGGGAPVGELGVSDDERTVLWTPAPGGAHPPDAELDTVVAGLNPHLRDFATAVWAGGDATMLVPLMQTIERAQSLSLPARFREDAATAVLTGQPLALARASLNLELSGPAATDESWSAFARAIRSGGGDDDDHGLPAVEFPVALGSLVQMDDTLVGYWAESGGRTDYSAFFAPGAPDSDGPVRPPAQTTIALSAAGPPTTPTLLLDPRGSVHATTGILPVKSIGIPPDQYGAALGALEVTFAAAPVLSGTNTGDVALTQPKVADGDWSWIAPSPSEWPTEALSDAPLHATMDYSPQRVVEGWLRLKRREPSQ